MRTTTAARAAALPVLLTRADLATAGLDTDVALRAVRRGTWSIVLPGAWSRRGGEVTRRERQEAALELLGDCAALTGADACSAYGMRDVPDGPVTVLVPHAVRRELGPEVRVIRTTADVPVLQMHGLPTVAPVRAVGDACRHQPLRQVRALVLAAVADGWVDLGELERLVDAGPRQGSAFLRRAVADAHRGARSAPEAELADVLVVAVRRAQLPPFLLNPDLLLDGEPVVTPDAYLLGLGIGGEMDSVRHHGSAAALDGTLLRHDRARRAGIELHHVTPTRFRADPQAYVNRLREAYAVRRRLAVPEPPGLVVVRHGPLLPTITCRR
jgi:hypothetical protein